MNKSDYVLFALMILLLLSMLTGCQPEQRWGTGEPPTEYQAFFGNGNMARLNFVQTNRINSFGQQLAELNERLRVLEAIDPNDASYQ